MDVQLTDEDILEQIRLIDNPKNDSNKKPKSVTATNKNKNDSAFQIDLGKSIIGSTISAGVSNKLSANTNLGSSMNMSVDSYEYELEKKNMNRTILLPTTPDISLLRNNYSIISCSIITTIIFNSSNLKFSFLTKPEDNSKNYFLSKQRTNKENFISEIKRIQNFPETLKFDAEKSGWDITKTNFKISEETMNNFISELNFFIDPLCEKFRKVQEVSNKKKNTFLKLSLISLVLFVCSLYAIYVDFFVETTFSLFFFFMFLIFTILSCVSLFSGVYHGIVKDTDEDMEYYILSNIISQYDVIEEQLQKWNQDVFLNLGMIVNIPHTLNYIHFCLDPYNELVLKNHNFNPTN